jgi:hypothetical protein
VEKSRVMAFKNSSGRNIGIAFESCSLFSNSSLKLVISDYSKTILEKKQLQNLLDRYNAMNLTLCNACLAPVDYLPPIKFYIEQ